MVQPELPPPDDGREVNGDSRQPDADAQAQGLPETVASPPGEPLQASFDEFVVAKSDEPPSPIATGAAVEPMAVEPMAPESSLAVDAPPSRASIRFAQVKEEVTAWFKTLVSAAVYAVLIVTFGFQVARVEGQSMAPTL